MSDTDVLDSVKEEKDDLQNAFVILLESYTVLFDKKQTPAVKAKKDKAAAEMALAYSKKFEINVTAKQIMKKVNNMKTKVKEATDIKRTGNKKIILTTWQKKFKELWNHYDGDEDNPVLYKVPGAVSSGFASGSSTVLIPPPPPAKKRLLEQSSHEPNEFHAYSLQQLQRTCLIQQIQTARPQEKAAEEMHAYYKRRNMYGDACITNNNNVTFCEVLDDGCE